MLPARVLRLLDLVIGLLALMLLTLVTVFPAPGFRARVLGGITVVTFVIGWLVWRRRGQRWGLGLLCVGTVLNVQLNGGSGLGSILLLVGVSLVSLGYGTTIALGVVAAIVALMALGTADAAGRSTAMAVADLVGAAIILLLGVLLGQALRELAAERHRNVELLDEVRRAAVTERELMLADERSRSARELHDGLGHQLTLVVLSLEFAERMRDKDPQRAFAEVQTARQTASEALAHMRRWVRALNPPREESVTGNAGFEAIARSFRGTGLDVRLSPRGQERELDRASSLFALRMVQEGLTNVVRHSAATSVDLVVDWQPDALRLVLADDGGAAAGLVPGFGLRSLAERARELGGSFEARGTERGVEISGTIPTQEEK